MLNKNSNISVDIILPNYNSEDFFEETIDSIFNQTFKNWNLIIIDDNSNLQNQEMIKRYSNDSRVKIIWLKRNKGTGFCRNIGLRYVKSNYIAFIDSDDIWYKDKLLNQINYMLEKNFEFTYTNYLTFKTGQSFLKENHKKNIVVPPKSFSFNEFIKNTSIGTSTMIIQKKLIGNTKFTKTKICEDYYFKCKILKKIDKAHCLSETLTKYRIRKNSLQSSKIKNLYWIWYINKNYNRFNFLENIISILFISFNSIRKYGFK